MKFIQRTSAFAFVLFFILLNCIGIFSQERSFYIDYEHNTFIKDGKPFRYVTGSIHSYRVPRELWYDRLYKIAASGLNGIEMYIFWSEHEPYPGVYDFEGINDVFAFMDIAKSLNLSILFRTGPYICAEKDYGGLPWWLLSNGVDWFKPRTNEANYMNAVRRWFNVFLPKVVPYLYKNGGPIITVQVENEYGSYPACDKEYMGSLRDIFKEHLGNDIVYFTTDGNDESYLKCGTIDGVYPTIDFNIYQNINASFQIQRKFAKNGPLINSEFYTGWLDYWGHPHALVKTEDFLKPLNDMLNMNVNLNLYMYHGGTNFGFTNGANLPYKVMPTSYDYDAPISEAGDVTLKYLALQDEFAKFLPKSNLPQPKNSTKLNLGNIQMTYHIPLVEAILELSDKNVKSEKPLSFERLGQGHGIILYTTTLDDLDVDGKVLSIPGIRDRAFVQIGSVSVGVLFRDEVTSIKINLKNNKDRNLFIIVENMGRLNFGVNMLDTKGIISDVTLDGKVLKGWTSFLTKNFIPYYQKKYQSNMLDDFVLRLKNSKSLLANKNLDEIDFKVPAIYIGDFNVPEVNGLFDTFLNMDKFNKGVALVRSSNTLSNLGRYWPYKGPQTTLYTPGVFLTPGSKNTLVLIEFEGSSCHTAQKCNAEFIDYPLIDTIPHTNKQK